MKYRILVVLLLILTILLSACAENKTPVAAATNTDMPATTSPAVKIKLPVGYVPDIQFAPLYVAIEKGYYSSEGLDVSLDYSMENDNTVLVGTGDLTFAIVSGEQVLLARAQQLPVVYVMSWYHQYPVGILTKTSSNIRSVADLRGKKIGLPGLYGASYIGAIALLDSAGLSQGDVTLDSIGYNQVAALVADKEDAVVVYAANEPLQLAKQGIDYTLFKTSDAVELVANGLITNEKTLQENPELVRKMVSATLKGILFSIDHPDEAYQISENYVPNLTSLDQQLQMQILLNSIEQWKTANPGLTDPKAWENMQAILLKMGLLASPLDLSTAYSNDYLPK
ncbi:MAG: ABC transporter substrate-binding protein [Anaerolineaceae bacterium]